MKKILTVVATLSVPGLSPTGGDTAAATTWRAGLANLSTAPVEAVSLRSAPTEATRANVSHGASVDLVTETADLDTTWGEQFIRYNEPPARRCSSLDAST